MSAAKTESIPTIDHKPHLTFFRQSGWLMVANIVGGLMTLGVHPLNKEISDAEYSAFGVLLMVVACLPTMPLQMVFAQQSAQALARGRERQLAGMIRLAWVWTFIIWALGAFLVFWFRGTITKDWQLPNTTGLLVTLPLLLVSLWMPMFSGVLQGRQDFFWLGWSFIFGGVGRLVIAAFLVLALGAGAAGMMTGALCGVALSAIIGIWRTRDLWSKPAEPFDGKNLMRQMAPLLFGFGAFQFMFTSDTMFAKAYFSADAMKAYVAAGTLSRGLLWIVLPLAAVMFPKIVHAHAKSEKSNLFGIVVLGTAALGICGMLGLWLLGPWVVKIVYKTSDVAATMALIPWYAGAMIPLAMANVLVNDLLARSKFQAVPFLVLLAMFYGLTLTQFHASLIMVLQVLGVFNTLLFAICAWFAWRKKPLPKN
ncbi:MAG TPA: lipid II flippase MurJ [Verrucomicrobiae bacterium]